MGSTDTIVALSSGAPPSAIAVVRASGPHAATVARAFGIEELVVRRASLRALRSPADGSMLDRALVFWFAGPQSATGEDVLELHCHGGPALVARVLSDAVSLHGVRLAEPGEFVLRSVLAGRMDLTDAEALADLLEAQTEAERRRASRLAGGALRERIGTWRAAIIALRAEVEAQLDFTDEPDVTGVGSEFRVRLDDLRADIEDALATSVDAERLSDGYDVAIVGPPNAGKSSLFNALCGTSAAIVTPEAGTTRDVLSRTVELAGFRVTLNDTAGVHSDARGVEAIGIARARELAARADLVVEVRSPDTDPLMIEDALVVHHKSDLGACATPATCVQDAGSIARLRNLIADRAAADLAGAEHAIITRQRQRAILCAAAGWLSNARRESDLELGAEALRLASHELARMTGEVGIEEVLDEVFGRFCIGK